MNAPVPQPLATSFAAPPVAPLPLPLAWRAGAFVAAARERGVLLPMVPVIITVLAFNFMGDGLRDAADPYA